MQEAIQQRLKIMVQFPKLAGCESRSMDMAGFAFAHFRFAGTKLLFYSASVMIPTTALLAPNFSTIRQLGIFDTWLAVAIPYFGSAFGTFLITSFFGP